MSLIDLNADLGEGGREEALYALVSSANVACGGHAGDAGSMAQAAGRALEHGVAVGAHPSYPDREGFGRRSIAIAAGALSDEIARQIEGLARIAAARGVSLRHVKPHGALYNDAARDRVIAAAIADGVARAAPDVVLFGLAGSVALDVWRDRGFVTAAEGFCDRAYEPEGTLVPRSRAGAIVADPAAASAQAIRLAHEGRCRTLCVHSDTPGVQALLRAVRSALEAAGWTISAEAIRR
jgi:UPF0271 protein